MYVGGRVQVAFYRNGDKQLKRKKSKGRGGDVRRRYYDEMVEDEGEFCKLGCGKNPPDVYLEIHHKNHDPHDNRRENRCFGCRSCNRKKPHGGRGRGKRKIVGTNPNDLAAPLASSAEFARGASAEPKFRLWLFNELKENVSITRSEAIASGAVVAGVTPKTIREQYLVKWCAERAPFKLDMDLETKEDIIVFRHPEKMLGLSEEMFEKLVK